MPNRSLILLIILSLDANALSCLPRKVSPAQLEEYKFVKSCESDNACPGYNKWDYLYFSKKIFGYEETNDFYSIKEKSYIENHCLGVISEGWYKYENGEGKLEYIDTVVLINSACPANGAIIKGKFIEQTLPRLDINACHEKTTGRYYLEIKNDKKI